MPDKLRLAVIGVGYLGRFHALIYSRMTDVVLVGVVDADAERAQAVATEAGCAVFDRAADLVDRVDAVSIVVPTTLHWSAAEPFLRRGIAVLIEKPIAATQADGAAIVQLAGDHGALVQIGHVERFNAGVMALAERITAPRYIEAQRMGGFTERATDVDVVSDLMIHDIDIILALVGEPISSISAVGSAVLTPHGTLPAPVSNSSTGPWRMSSRAVSRTNRPAASASSNRGPTCRWTSSRKPSTAPVSKRYRGPPVPRSCVSVFRSKRSNRWTGNWPPSCNRSAPAVRHWWTVQSG